ncbi:Acetylornithine deacetylase/Succinyl-diaminopimelate desuccinylase [Goodfellowiella coeruleoviolacea]|uniref:Acetylornithine deacetylase/Succinyl-diaminopimelate desuccinylase n=1 Tax=Goodfellowiella coeruleoviolacea TaxID=334858 RepID=A0AAE3GJS9_9PSEU|nr:Acetylornithine deacetylase/Succinyl-diaminopimelate desuccinylase [Goodfellowiella coeruleoviolacea]
MHGLADDFVAELCEWIAIPSIGADPAHHADVARSAEWLATALRRDGWPTVEVWDTGPALPAVYACWPAEDPAAPVVLVYGHHDVQPVDPVEHWQHPPFEAVVRGEELFGRGASDDKGQVAMHLLGLRAHLAATGQTAPSVTLKLLVEGEEESGSPHIATLLAEHRTKLGADLVVFTDTPLFDRSAPTVCTGQRGHITATITMTSGNSDLHSGRFGGGVPNAAIALARLVAAVHDEQGRIAIPGFYDDVREPSALEREHFARLPFDEAAWLAGPADGVTAATGEAGWTTLERTWVRPTAEITGIHGGYTGPGVKTIVPRQASTALTCRLVPDQQLDRVQELIRRFVAEHTPPGVTAEVVFHGSGVPPYAVDIDHPATLAVRDALAAAFDQEVLFSRTGGSGPAALLHAWLDVPVVYFGATLPDDRIHAPNERVVLPVLLRGAEALARLWRLLPDRLRTPAAEPAGITAELGLAGSARPEPGREQEANRA